MPIYINSKGDEVLTEGMDEVYIERALAKAQADNNTGNIEALNAEIANRQGSN